MSILSGLRSRARAIARPSHASRELDDEIRFHLDQETEKNIRAGMSPAEARRLAVAHFGGVQRAREDHRDVRRLVVIEDFIADARFAFRALRRTPALSAAAVITLAMGIGANVAIFSAVNAVVLQPLPFPTADRLMTITEENPEKHWHLATAAPANLLDWRTRVADFADVTGYIDGVSRSTLVGRGSPQLLNVTPVMGNFFSVLGVGAVKGRALEFADTWHPQRDTTHVLVLSDRGWRTHFGADPEIVGKSAVIDGQTFTIVGVMPASFLFPAPVVDAWQSIEWDQTQTGNVGFRRAHYMRALALLKPGVRAEHAALELQTAVSQLKVEFPATNRVMGAAMMPLHDFLVGDTRLPLLVLLASVAFLLLIACANVGNLLLVQAAGRERESALRLALGAGRSRLVRQALTESLVLSLIGGSVGLAMGWAGTRALVWLQPAGMLPVSDFGVDRTVVVYVVAITFISALIFGVAPALLARHRDPADSLRHGGRGASGGARMRRWGDALVAIEVGLALLMTVGAGLLVRSFIAVQQVDAGFDPRGVLAASVAVNAKYDTSTKVGAFMDAFQARLAALPGVESVALVSNMPFRGTGYTTDFIAAGRPDGGYGTEIGNRTVTANYFSTMHVHVLRGRTFGPEDREGSTPVLVINDALASSYFKGQNPVGQRITFGKVITPASVWYTIIGVVANEHVKALDAAPVIEAFHAESQEPSGYMAALLRTTGDPARLVPAVRATLTNLDPTLALLDAAPVEMLRDKSMARSRFLTIMLIAFAAIGLVLSVVGVYGVLEQSSRNRTREMGIRVALGAPATAVRWLVVRRGLTLASIGLGIGGVFAVLTTRFMTALLFHVTPTDPVTLGVVAVLLLATSAIAAWVPASRASRVDPISALRSE